MLLLINMTNNNKSVKVTRTCKSILPSFLWNNIVDYLSLDVIYKLVDVNSQFGTIISDNTWKRYFFDREDDIVFVKCESKRIEYFWKYACYNYIVCDNINEMFDIIASDNKINSRYYKNRDLIYYKAFIKTGEYVFNSHTNDSNSNYCFDDAKCSIEIFGSNYGDSKTILEASSPSKYNIFLDYIYILFIKNVTFNNIDLCLKKYNYDIKLNYTISQLHITNCIFENKSILIIDSIDNFTITKCIFDMALIQIRDDCYLLSEVCSHDCSREYFNVNTCQHDNKDCPLSIAKWRETNDDKYPLKISHTISYNTIIHDQEWICIKGDYDESSVINIVNNKLIKHNMFNNTNLNGVSVIFDNTIMNTDTKN